MALAFADRVRETTTTTGTGTITLAGAVTGYQSFSAIGNGNTTYYTINAGSQWEVGIGTYTASGTTLSRDTVLSSSNAGSLVDFSAGTKDVFAGYPAGKVVIQDASGNVGIGTNTPAGKFSSNTGANGTYVSVPGNVTGWDATTSLFGAAGSTTGAAVGIGMTAAGGYISSLAPSVAWQNLHYQASTHYWYNGVTQLGVLNTAGDFTAVGSVRAPIFYDSANTAYYLDPTGSTSLNVAGNMLAAGNVELGNGANRRVRIGSATNYNYDLQTTGDDFQIIEAGTTPRLTIKYPNGYVGIGTTSPSLPLVVSNAGAGGLEFNHSGAIGNGTYIQSYNRSTAAYIPNTNYALSQTWYSGATRAMDLDSSGNLGIGTSSPSAKLDVVTAGAFAAEFNGTNTYVDIIDSTVTGRLQAVGNVFYIGTTAAVKNLGFKSGAGVEAMLITSAGNVGIGTSSPSARLAAQVNSGNYLLDLVNGSETGFALRTYNHGSASAPGLVFTQGLYYATTENASIKFYRGGGATGGYLGFTTGSGTEQLSINSSGNVTATVDVRAPIFYDSNNTGYYVDPAGDSVFNTLFVKNSSGINVEFAYGSNFGYSSSYKTVVLGNEYLTTISMGVDVSGNASGSFNGLGEGREVIFRNGVNFITPNSANNSYLNPFGMADGYAYSTGSFRAPIFYDSNDTGRYVDPAGTSSLYTLLVNNGLGVYDSSNNDPYGKLSVTRSSGANYTYLGFTRSGQTAIGMGIDTSNAFWIGSSSAGYDGVRTGTALSISAGGAVTATTDIRAPIFYDSSNTGYYLDPASTSLTYRMGAYYLQNNADVSDDHPFGLYFSSGLSTAYAIFRESGAWTHPYPDLRIAFHTGIKMGANAGYGGMKFYTDYDMSSQVMSINNSADGLGGGNVFVNSSLVAASSLRAPIFYDSNNTGYYLDPQSGSRLGGQLLFDGGSQIQSNGDIYARRSSGSTGVYYFVDGVNKYLFWDGGQYLFGPDGPVVTNGASMRAPIFYDVSNTAYYLDPASTSLLNIVNLPSGSAAINTTTPGTTTYQLNFTGQSTADNAQAITWGWSTSGAQAGIYVQSSGSYGTKMYLATTDSFATGARTALAIDHVGVITTTRNYLQATGSLRAPIFYDSDDTSRYLDPSSTSVISNLIMANSGPVLTLRDTDSTGAAQIGYISFQDSGNAERAWFGYGSTANTILYMRNSVGPNYMFADYTEATGSLRAPIFYDSDNTAYYVDAAGTSVINSTQFGTTPGSPGNGRVITSPGSPYSIRQEFGTDNSGWRYGIAKNASGTVTVLFYVQDNGDCVATGNVTAYSDIRVKDNVETIPAALAKLSAIRGVTYTRTDLDDKERRYAGVIAQEIEQVLPEAIGGDEHIKTVDYNATIALLIQAVKELSAEVQLLKAKEY